MPEAVDHRDVVAVLADGGDAERVRISIGGESVRVHLAPTCRGRRAARPSRRIHETRSFRKARILPSLPASPRSVHASRPMADAGLLIDLEKEISCFQELYIYVFIS